MTLSDLIDQLTALAEEMNPSGDLFAECNPEVIVAYQPNWPMEVQITEIVALDPVADFDEDYGSEPVVNREDINAWREARDAAEAQPKSIIIGTAWGNEYLRSGGATALGWR